MFYFVEEILEPTSYRGKMLYANQKDSLELIETKIHGNFCSTILITDDESKLVGIITPYEIRDFYKNNDNVDLCRDEVSACDICNKSPIVISEDNLSHHKLNRTDPFKGIRPSIHVMPVVMSDGKIKSIILRKIKQPTILSIYIDLVDSCNLKCPMCIRGIREMKNTSSKMSLEMFEQVVKKSVDYGPSNFRFFNWADAFLCPNLDAYLKIVKAYNLPMDLSTNLSLPYPIKSLEPVLYSGCTHIYVSVSGFTQDTHSVYHRGSNIETVKKHLEFMSVCYSKKPFCTTIVVKYIDFGFNRAEIPLFKEYVEKLGFMFQAVIGDGNYSRLDAPTLDYSKDNEYRSDTNVAARYLNSYYKKKDITINGVCDSFYAMFLDSRADAYLCCLHPNHNLFRIGNFLEDSIDELLLKRFLHPICQMCNRPKNYEVPRSLIGNIVNSLL